MDDGGQLLRQAALMSKALRKVTGANRKTAILWINQTRVNPGITFGNNEAIPGGKALPFYCTYILGMYKGAAIKKDLPIIVTGPDGKPTKKVIKMTVAHNIRAELKKSKLNKPFREENFVYSLQKGEVDDWLYLANKGLELGLLGYERARWWTPEDSKRMPEEEFRGHLPISSLKMLKGTVYGVESAGSAPRGSKKAAERKPPSSSATAPKPTRTPALAKSSSTAATTTKSSKSRMPKKATGSATSTSSSSGKSRRVVAVKVS
jgi:recombination protein RecA